MSPPALSRWSQEYHPPTIPAQLYQPRPDPIWRSVDRDGHRRAPFTVGDQVGTGIRLSDFLIVLAVAGVLFALATVRPRRWLPPWLLHCSLWPLAALMVLRAVSASLGDVQQLATGRPPARPCGIWSSGRRCS